MKIDSGLLNVSDWCFSENTLPGYKLNGQKNSKGETFCGSPPLILNVAGYRMPRSHNR
jgi:hypothetical protein